MSGPRYCIDQRCREKKRPRVYTTMATALARLTRMYDKDPKEAKRHQLVQCIDCDMWRLDRAP